MRLQNKVAVITGSSRGIGRATAILFAQEGAKVVVNCRRDTTGGEEVLSEIKNKGGEAIFVQADIAKPNDVETLFNEVKRRYNTVDIVVNNAGIAKAKSFMQLSVDDWEETLRINLMGVFLCSKEAAKIMLEKKRGKIVNVASIRGLYHCGRPEAIPYTVSKAGVISFTKTLAKELSPFINVNAVAPGFVETKLAKEAWDEKVRKSIIEDTYLKRLLLPEEIAKAILYLASEDADAITGEVLVIDAGYQLK